MATKAELLELTNVMIKKLHDDINALQADALRLSAAGELDKCGEVLKKQRDAINAQIAMIEAARFLESN